MTRSDRMKRSAQLGEIWDGIDSLIRRAEVVVEGTGAGSERLARRAIEKLEAAMGDEGGLIGVIDALMESEGEEAATGEETAHA